MCTAKISQSVVDLWRVIAGLRATVVRQAAIMRCNNEGAALWLQPLMTQGYSGLGVQIS